MRLNRLGAIDLETMLRYLLSSATRHKPIKRKPDGNKEGPELSKKCKSAKVDLYSLLSFLYKKKKGNNNALYHFASQLRIEWNSI